MNWLIRNWGNDGFLKTEPLNTEHFIMRMRKPRFYLALFAGLLMGLSPELSFGQSTSLSWLEYTTFQELPPRDSVEPQALYLRLKSTSYFKNNEYKNEFMHGYSLTGLYFEPVLEYTIDSSTMIRAGAHLLKYYGRDSFDRTLPVISIMYSPGPHFRAIFGTLYGTTSHGLPEPVYNFEKYLIDNYENGIQFLWDYQLVKADIWLNWEQFIKQGDPFQERFTVGANTAIRVMDWKGFRLTLPFAILFRHRGGEIDATTLPAGTQSNMVLGTRIDWEVGKGFFRDLWIYHQFIEFMEVNPGDQITIPFGHGMYSRMGINTKIGSIEVGYWDATNFISPHGMPIFQSVSQNDPMFYLADRKMLTVKYEFYKPLTSYLDAAFRFEPYYHFYTGRMDHSWSIYLRLNESFFLTHLRPFRKKSAGSEELTETKNRRLLGF